MGTRPVWRSDKVGQNADPEGVWGEGGGGCLLLGNCVVNFVVPSLASVSLNSRNSFTV